MELAAALQSLIAEQGLPLYGVADTDGFAHAQPDWHPRRLLPRARRALVFGLPFVGPRLTVDEKTGLSNDDYWQANAPVLARVAHLRCLLLNLLDSFGYAALNIGGFNAGFQPTFSYRLAQHEAGVGVYGRFGVCLNPTFGCGYTTGVLLTDAPLPPTPRGQLAGYAPCRDCRRCAEACPARAIDADLEPEVGYDRDRCIRYIRALKRKHGAEAKACSRCFSMCPWSSRP